MKTIITLLLIAFAAVGYSQITTDTVILKNGDVVYKTVSTIGAGSVTVTEGVNTVAMDSNYVNMSIISMDMELEMMVQDSIMVNNRLQTIRQKKVKYILIKDLFTE